MDAINAKTGMTHAEAREFIRNHFEEFVNRKNLAIGNVNFAFAAAFVDHGSDVSQSGKRLEFRGIVIWRIANRQIAERWAYLEAPHPA